MPDSQPNRARGEVAITLNGLAHVMRPTFEAIVATETATGRTIGELCQSALSARLSLQDVAAVVLHGITASGVQPAPTLRAVTEQVFKNGLADTALWGSVTVYLMAALRGGVLPEEEEAQAETGKDKADAASPSAAT